MTYFLRFDHEGILQAACMHAGICIDHVSPRPLPLSLSLILDVIGTVTEGGEWDPDTGEVIMPPVVLPGWHVNAKFTNGLPDGWDTYLVTPASPVRVFAGD